MHTITNFLMKTMGLLVMIGFLPSIAWAQNPRVVTQCQVPSQNLSNVNLQTGITYAVMGGVDQKLDIATPKTGSAFPLVVLIHGGGWSQGDKSAKRGDIIRLANDGYAAVSINYRLVKNAQNTFPSAPADVRCAIRYLKANAQNWGVDSNKIAAIGSSAGGHLAGLLATAKNATLLDGNLECPLLNISPKVNGVVAFFGPHDLRPGAAGLSNPNSLQTVTNFLGVAPSQDPNLAASASPITYVNPQAAPMLLVHGSLDPGVPIDQAIQMRNRLQQDGVPSTLLTMPNESHGFPILSDLLRLRASTCSTLAFLQDTLKASSPAPTPTPVPPPPSSNPTAQPSNLVGVIVGSNQVNLTWIDQSTNEAGFEIQRCGGPNPCPTWAPLQTTLQNVVSSQDLTVQPNTSYRFRVRAFNGAGNSRWSGTDFITTPAAGPALPTPTPTPAPPPPSSPGLLFHTNLNSSGTTIQPNLGFGNGLLSSNPSPTFDGSSMLALGRGVTAQFRQRTPGGPNVELDHGTVEFLFKPSFNKKDNVKISIAGTGAWRSPGSWHFGKHNRSNQFGLFLMMFDANGNQRENFVTGGNYSWTKNQWMHIRIVWNHGVAPGVSNFRIYFNDVLLPLNKKSVGFQPMPQESSQLMYLGARDTNTQNPIRAGGRYDEFKIWDRVILP